MEAVELGREQGFGFFHNERRGTDEVSAEAADDWEGSLGSIADFMLQVNLPHDNFDASPEMQLLMTRCSLANVAWIAVHDRVLPDFRSRGLASNVGYAHMILMVGWKYFDVEPADQLPFIDSVLDCEDARLNRYDVAGSDDEDGYL